MIDTTLIKSILGVYYGQQQTYYYCIACDYHCPFSRFIGNAAEFYKNRCRCPN